MADDINWTLIMSLATKPHKHLSIVDGAQYGLMVNGVFDGACNGVGEVMQQARIAQHLLDLAGVPEGKGDGANIDARVYLLVTQVRQLREQLSRIAGWHARESGPHGMVGDLCTECGEVWPCDTRRMADGTYVDEDAP